MSTPSIRGRLTRTILGIFFLAVAGGVGAIYALFRLALVDQFDAALRTKAQALSALVSTDGPAEGAELSARFMRGPRKADEADFYELWALDGTVIARSGTLAGADLPRPTEPTLRPRFRRVQLPNGRALTAVDLAFAPRHGPGAPIPGKLPVPSVQLTVATDRGELDELLTWLALICGAAVVLLSAAALLIPPVLRRLLRPLDDLAAQTRSIDAESLATRLPTAGLPAELQPIAQCLNDLFIRLESSFDRERQVSADLAHELRTPLAELKTWAGCALKWPETRDPSTDREIMASAEHMEAIVTRMLALARSELGQIPLAAEPVDVSALLAQTWKSFAPRAEAKDLRVEWDLRPATRTTDPALLRSILNNLLENAVEYAPAGGRIRIGAGAADGEVAIEIANTTTGLRPQDIARFFERFWRKEQSRSGEQHCGLGLAIAQSFARSLGWRLTASLADDQLLTFALTSAPTFDSALSRNRGALLPA